MKPLHLVKIGGTLIDDEETLTAFLNDFSRLEGYRILVHGGGSKASKLSQRLGIKVAMNEGRRITDADSLEVVTMVYAGLINKTLVARLQALDCNAVGLTGADLNVIPARKRVHTTIDYGFVGDIESSQINSYLIRRLMDENVVPVFSAITHDTKGQLLNTNADTIASTLAVALASKYEVTLTICLDKPGVLRDVDDPGSRIPVLDQRQYGELKQSGIIHEGMIPKLDNGFNALRDGVKHVSIKHSKNLLNETGTRLTL